ncbi:hypothetical protein QBB34_29400 [Streptomyces stelliscabiei]|uniref:hypothetical protein n=1 Tax=Streptomyces stelliscabiei TaxID=146820 RepID=UPI002FF0C49B
MTDGTGGSAHDLYGSATPKELFSDAYDDLWAEWERAGHVVAVQDLITELSNATAAASGDEVRAGERLYTSPADPFQGAHGVDRYAIRAALNDFGLAAAKSGPAVSSESRMTILLEADRLASAIVEFDRPSLMSSLIKRRQVEAPVSRRSGRLQRQSAEAAQGPVGLAHRKLQVHGDAPHALDRRGEADQAVENLSLEKRVADLEKVLTAMTRVKLPDGSTIFGRLSPLLSEGMPQLRPDDQVPYEGSDEWYVIEEAEPETEPSESDTGGPAA